MPCHPLRLGWQTKWEHVELAFILRLFERPKLKSPHRDSRLKNETNEGSVPTASNFAPQTAESVVINRYQDLEDAETMMTYYDLQSNRWCSNRMYQLPNGNVGVVGTMSHEANLACSDRGTGYNFYNGDWMEEPETRVEPYRAGWPTIAQYGETGEVMVSHAPIHCYVREVAGEGEWIDMGLLPASPEGYPYDHELSWPRIATSGENHNIIHLIACIQHAISSDEIALHQVYYRSEDGGQTWITASHPSYKTTKRRGITTLNPTTSPLTVTLLPWSMVTTFIAMSLCTNPLTTVKHGTELLFGRTLITDLISKQILHQCSLTPCLVLLTLL